ncbi:pyridoxamine 5'-phosphate oxidase family protein [Streptomyces collinus]|uniref:pyridoxamine 5'-phosphate oxidase family protein n=1 Tax=Streptomyces collinus TaxID=42684 RepID=UPI0036B18F84
MHHDERAERPGSHGEHQIQRDVGTVDRADRFYDEQVLDRLNSRMTEFVARQEMFFLATADRHGECDSTFRAGPAGFLQVIDAGTLVYPEYRGNGVMASLGNIRENPHVGILMIDFSQDRIGLHVNGRAQLVTDEAMRSKYPGLPVDPVPGRRPQMWVEVEVEEAYIHCSKHIPRLVKAPLRQSVDGAQGAAGEDGQAWGTDDVRRKGGDYFGAAAGRHGLAPR